MRKKIGIVAEKLSHSLSPIIHNYWIKINKIDAEYVCYEIKPNEINQFYKDFKKDSYRGIYRDLNRYIYKMCYYK